MNKRKSITEENPVLNLLQNQAQKGPGLINFFAIKEENTEKLTLEIVQEPP